MRHLSQDKSGQWVFAGIMIATMVIIILTQIIPIINTQVATMRSASNLDCSNSSISTGTSMACIVVDTYTFYFAGMVIAFAMAYIFMKTRARKDLQ